MFEIIKNVILKWDPISLMEFAPPDEYDQECTDIFQAYTEKQKPLSEIIYDIFTKAFEDEWMQHHCHRFHVCGIQANLFPANPPYLQALVVCSSR